MTNWKFEIQKLLAMRDLKNLSRKDCAVAIGKSEAAFGMKERGKTAFTVSEVCALANTFGVDPRSFFVQKSTGEKKAA